MPYTQEGFQYHKASFRGAREFCGLSQNDVARALGTTVEVVRGWEKPGPNGDIHSSDYAPKKAWDYIEHEVGVLLDLVQETRTRIHCDIESNGYFPDVYPVSYLRDAEHFAANGGDPDGNVHWGMLNAWARYVALTLALEGIQVEFYYPEDENLGIPGHSVFKYGM